MKTTAKESPTREKLLDKAQELMLAKGFSATTVDDICKAAKVTKGSFFHYFESKEELGRAVLEHFCGKMEKLHRAAGSDDPDPLKRLYGYLDGMAALCRDPELSKGCLLGMFAQELSDTCAPMRSACCAGFDRWAGQFTVLLKQAKEAHPPKTDFQPRSLAEHLIAVLEGGLILVKARKSQAPLIESLQHYKKYLRTLFGK